MPASNCHCYDDRAGAFRQDCVGDARLYLGIIQRLRHQRRASAPPTRYELEALQGLREAVDEINLWSLRAELGYGLKTHTRPLSTVEAWLSRIEEGGR